MWFLHWLFLHLKKCLEIFFSRADASFQTKKCRKKKKSSIKAQRFLPQTTTASSNSTATTLAELMILLLLLYFLSKKSSLRLWSWRALHPTRILLVQDWPTLLRARSFANMEHTREEQRGSREKHLIFTHTSKAAGRASSQPPRVELALTLFWHCRFSLVGISSSSSSPLYLLSYPCAFTPPSLSSFFMPGKTYPFHEAAADRLFTVIRAGARKRGCKTWGSRRIQSLGTIFDEGSSSGFTYARAGALFSFIFTRTDSGIFV